MRFLLLSVLAAGVTFTNSSNVQVSSVQLYPLADGGAAMQVYASFFSDDGGVTFQVSPTANLNAGGPAQTCAVGLLNASANRIAGNAMGFGDGGTP